MAESQSMRLADGRTLAWSESGDDRDSPLFVFHGTPGSRLQFAGGTGELDVPGRRLICVDRPGYGMSTLQPDRRLADWPLDVAALADHLGIECFEVMGFSGGGPHAMACAAILGGRVDAAVIVSGIAPLSDPSAYVGMARINRVLMRLSRYSELPVRILIAPQTASGRCSPTRGVDSFAKRVPAPDAAVLARPEVRAMFESDLGHASSTTARAVAQDLRLFHRDWGFSLADIAVPVHIWQGTADVNVPPIHARILHGAIPGSILHELSDEGYLLVYGHLAEILATSS